MRLVLAALVLITCTLGAAGCAASRPQPASSAGMSTRFAGPWEGHLQYRDYQSDKYVKLPMKLDVREDASVPGRATWQVEYDDGPGKTITSTEVVHIDREGGTVTLSSEDGATVERLDILLDDVEESGLMVLRTEGSDDDRPASIVKLLTFRGDGFSILKLVQYEGAELEYRNHMTLRRAAGGGANPQP